MMLINSDQDFQLELNKLGIKPINVTNDDVTSNITSNAQVIDIQRGRTPGRTEIPSELRKVIGSCALIDSAKDVAQAFGISESSISAYKVGATSTTNYHSPDPDLKKHIDSKRGEISDTARTKLLDALELITAEKVSGAKIKDIASIAKDMSAIIKNVEPNPLIGVQMNNQVVVYRPKMNDESDYDVITVNE